MSHVPSFSEPHLLPASLVLGPGTSVGTVNMNPHLYFHDNGQGLLRQRLMYQESQGHPHSTSGLDFSAQSQHWWVTDGFSQAHHHPSEAVVQGDTEFESLDSNALNTTASDQNGAHQSDIEPFFHPFGGPSNVGGYEDANLGWASTPSGSPQLEPVGEHTAMDSGHIALMGMAVESSSQAHGDIKLEAELATMAPDQTPSQLHTHGEQVPAHSREAPWSSENPRSFVPRGMRFSSQSTVGPYVSRGHEQGYDLSEAGQRGASWLKLTEEPSRRDMHRDTTISSRNRARGSQGRRRKHEGSNWLDNDNVQFQPIQPRADAPYGLSISPNNINDHAGSGYVGSGDWSPWGQSIENVSLRSRTGSSTEMFTTTDGRTSAGWASHQRSSPEQAIFERSYDFEPSSGTDHLGDSMSTLCPGNWTGEDPSSDARHSDTLGASFSRDVEEHPPGRPPQFAFLLQVEDAQPGDTASSSQHDGSGIGTELRTEDQGLQHHTHSPVQSSERSLGNQSRSPSATDFADPLPCPEEGCHVTFSGDFRRGNLARHRRLVHRGAEYPCEAEDCGKSFKRKDARLKHYRKHHEDLCSNSPYIRRKIPGGPALEGDLDQAHVRMRPLSQAGSHGTLGL
ncbi:hypothetical protein BDV96DRAFT_282315 [Lophiotrema nucula]|uniref:C2H2-type domain-containing protein n=1 Tax=Lophiotrema nucula TaxID=690887 RepID=A0A6A5ZMX6_9PLEO|nr:hypothetical protein BDV96DRAFT_282315 [Lophiotrema nucula]